MRCDISPREVAFLIPREYVESEHSQRTPLSLKSKFAYPFRSQDTHDKLIQAQLKHFAVDSNARWMLDRRKRILHDCPMISSTPDLVPTQQPEDTTYRIRRRDLRKSDAIRSAGCSS